MVALPKVKLPRPTKGKKAELDDAVAMVAASHRAGLVASSSGSVSVSVRRGGWADDEVETEFVENKENARRAPTPKAAAPPARGEDILQDLEITPQRQTVARSNVSRTYEEAMASSVASSARKGRRKTAKDGRKEKKTQADSGRAFGGTRAGSEALRKEKSSRKIKTNQVPKTIVSEPRQPGFVAANGSSDSTLSGDTALHGKDAVRGDRDVPAVEDVRSGESSVTGATRQQALRASAPSAAHVAAAATVAAAADDTGELEVEWAGAPEKSTKPFVPANAIQPKAELNNLVAGHDPVRLVMPFLVNYGHQPRPDQAWQYCQQPGGQLVICEQPVPIVYPQNQLMAQPQMAMQPYHAMQTMYHYK